MRRFAITTFLTFSVFFLITSCSSQIKLTPTPDRVPVITVERSVTLDNAFLQLMDEHDVVTVGAAVIKNGKLIWSNVYGEQAPGISASSATQFDIASMTKTVTAETVLRLADQGRIDLDEPMVQYYVDPDIADNPFSQMLTPRMVLSHSTGLPNWRFLADDGSGFDPQLPLRFLFEPGTSYSYSGEAMEYLAKYAEAKLGVDFEDLVIETVFDPIGMMDASFSAREANFSNITRARDNDGEWIDYYCRPGGFLCRTEGQWSAADDMRVTIEDHAKFLIAVMNHSGYSANMAGDRDVVHREKWNSPQSILVLCDELAEGDCPERQGYGLGWEVADYGDHKLISHGGSDFSEVTIGYFYSDTKDGVLVFLNAPNELAMNMMPRAIELLDPRSPIIPHYKQW